jgi:glucose-6-phosphate 1-dehydrogenase
MALNDFDLVLFGGSGDLSMRKLLPAMYSRDVCGDLPPSARIICVGRQDCGQEEFIGIVNSTSRPLIKSPAVTAEAWARFTARIVYVSLNATDSSTYGGLVDAVRNDDNVTRV